MSDLYGYSFSPDLANRFKTSLNNPTGASQLPQNVGQALQVLSLHLPSFLGGSPIAPDALLRGSRGLTPDAAVRGMTTGSPAPPVVGPPPTAAPTPTPDSPALSILRPGLGGGGFGGGGVFGGGGSDPGPQAPPSAPGNPNVTFTNPPGSGPTGPAPDTGGSSSLLALLDGLLRGGGGAGGGDVGGQDRHI